MLHNNVANSCDVWLWIMRLRLQDLLKRLCYAVRLHVRVPVLLPAVALPTHLTLERLQTHVLVHVLLQIFCFIESLVAAEGRGGRHFNNELSNWLKMSLIQLDVLLTEHRRMHDQ